MAKSLSACPGCGTSAAPAPLAVARTQRNGADGRGARIFSAEASVLPGRLGAYAPGSFPCKTSNSSPTARTAVVFRNNSNLRLDLISAASLCPGINGLDKQDRTAPPVQKGRKPQRRRGSIVCAASNGVGGEGSARLVTFLGKGGSGKTTAAVLLAKVSRDFDSYRYWVFVKKMVAQNVMRTNCSGLVYRRTMK